ncbi:MAG: RNA polymerase sigma factor [Pedobacter sp.]|jgi:RNA polymerase sigma-70 factor (ECF subfamily)
MSKASNISESELIQECKKGSLKYQEVLYKHFFSFAMGVGMRYLSNRDDTLEIVNDSFIKVFKSIKDFKNDQNLKPWLSRIVINTALDRRRRDLKHQNQTDLENASEVSYPAQALDNLNARDICKLMDKLPSMQRMVFNMYEIDGYSHEEIGNILQIPASSSRVNLSRAKEKLREAFSLEQSA